MRKFLKVVLYVIGSILVLLLAVIVWLNTDSGKNFVRTRAVAFLRNKLKTEVSIARPASFLGTSISFWGTETVRLF